MLFGAGVGGKHLGWIVSICELTWRGSDSTEWVGVGVGQVGWMGGRKESVKKSVEEERGVCYYRTSLSRRVVERLERLRSLD